MEQPPEMPIHWEIVGPWRGGGRGQKKKVDGNKGGGRPT